MTSAGLRGSLWRDRQLELLLMVALGDAGSARAAWAQARPGLDFELLPPGVTSLMPLVYTRLVELGIEDSELPRLKGLHRRTWYANNVLLDRGQHVTTALRNAGLRVVVVDGAAVVRHYPDAATRRIPFVELLVEAGASDAARAIVQRLGLRRARSAPPELGAPEPFEDANGQVVVLSPQVPLDLIVPGAAPTSADDFWDATTTSRIGGADVPTLAPTDELLFACVTGVRASILTRRVQWVPDACMILQSSGGRIDWGRLVEQAAKRRIAPRARDGLAYLSRVHGANVPPDVLRELKAVPATRRERVAHRLGGADMRALGGLPQTFEAYARLTAHRSAGSAVRDFPGFLRDRWGLDRSIDLPMAVLRRAGRAVASRHVANDWTPPRRPTDGAPS